MFIYIDQFFGTTTYFAAPDFNSWKKKNAFIFYQILPKTYLKK